MKPSHYGTCAETMQTIINEKEDLNIQYKISAHNITHT